MPIDVCKLCLQTKELRDSHMLPSAVWRLLNEPGHKLNHPILMTEKLALISSRQIHNYVLCADCEQLLNKNGEHFTIAQMRGRRGFPLLDRLRKTTPIASFESVSSYSGSAAGVDTEKLVYFGLSVVWRAGAYKRKNLYFDNPIYFLDLGPFLEPMRQYLLGTAPFPFHITVNVQAASDTQSQCSAYPPAWAAGGTVSHCRVSRVRHPFRRGDGESTSARLPAGVLPQHLGEDHFREGYFGAIH